MDKKTFENLSLLEKGITLLDVGKHIAQVKKQNHILNLYSLNDFFVEVYFSIKNSKIDKIEIVNESDLDFYIDNVLKDKNLNLN